MPHGSAPAARVWVIRKRPEPSPSRMVTAPALGISLATARSGFPSPLKSATAMEHGLALAAKGLPGAEINVPDGTADIPAVAPIRATAARHALALIARSS